MAAANAVERWRRIAELLINERAEPRHRKLRNCFARRHIPLRSPSRPGCVPRPEVGTLGFEKGIENHLVRLMGTVDEAGLACLAVDPSERGVVRITARAADLDADIGSLVQQVGDMYLGHRHFLSGK